MTDIEMRRTGVIVAVAGLALWAVVGLTPLSGQGEAKLTAEEAEAYKTEAVNCASAPPSSDAGKSRCKLVAMMLRQSGL